MVIFALGINLFISSVILFIDFTFSAKLKSVLSLRGYPSDAFTNAIVIASYAVLIAILACLPSYYTPTPDHADGPFSAVWVFFFLPSTRGVSWLWSIYPAFPWLAPAVFGLMIGRCVTNFKMNVARQALLCTVTFQVFFHPRKFQFF